MSLKEIFSNVIICEDIRTEIGKKFALLGVISGDIIADKMPANIKIAIYIELINIETEMSLTLKLFQNTKSDKKEMGAINIANIKPETSSTIIVPQGIASVDQDCILTIVAESNNEEVEIARRRIYQGDVNVG